MTTTQLTRMNSGKKYGRVAPLTDITSVDIFALAMGMIGVVALCIVLCKIFGG